MGAKISKCCRCKSKQKENENGVEAIIPTIQVYEETKNDDISETFGEPNLDFSFQLERELDFHFNSIRTSTPQDSNQLVTSKTRAEPCDLTSEDSGSFYDAEEYDQESTKKQDLVKTLANVTAKPLSDLQETRSLSYKEIDQSSNSEVETKDLQSTDKDVRERIGTKNHIALDSELTDEERDFNNTRLVLECKYEIDLSKPKTIGEKQPSPNASIISTDSLTAFSEQILLDQNAKTSPGSSDNEENVQILVSNSPKDINEEESYILTEQVLHNEKSNEHFQILPIRTNDRSDDDLQKKTRASADTESLKEISHTLLDQNATYQRSSSRSSNSGENVHILVSSAYNDVNGEESPVLTDQISDKDESTKYFQISPIRSNDGSDDDLQKKTRTSADTESLKKISHTSLDQNATYRKSSSDSSDSGENDHILAPGSRKNVNDEESQVLRKDDSRKYSQILPERIDDRFDDDLQKKTHISTEYFNEISHRNEDDDVLNHEADDDLKPNNATITELKAIIESINILEADIENLDKQDTYQTLIKIMMQVNQVKNEDFDEEILHLQNKALNQINRCLRILK